MHFFNKQENIIGLNQEPDQIQKLLKGFCHYQLFDNILPFWVEKSPDEKHGGFVGEISDINFPVLDAHKGLILNARILWTFSAVYKFKKDEVFREMADRAFNYLMTFFKDMEYGGYYWSLDYTGVPIDNRKQIYGQAFVIYALSEYYKINKQNLILNELMSLFRMVERYAFDNLNLGYFEAFTREWEPVEDARLSAIDMNEKKTMNTHLHLLEAYTNLYRVWHDDILKSQLNSLIRVFLDNFIHTQDFHLNLFFDENWNLKSNNISFGHDIEASWLLIEAAEVLGKKNILNEVTQVTLRMANTVSKGNNNLGGLIYEMERGQSTGEGMEWWTESEAIVGFYNAWQLSGQTEFLKNALNKAKFIDRYYTDHENGEWHNRLDENGEPVKGLPKAGFWKCPYHNARMCLELIERIN